jgi:ankyrin repeat protein
MEAFVAACMRADHETVQRLTADDPTLAQRVIAIVPELIIRAAELNRPDTVRLMAAVGFDVNIRRRIAPLHTAAHGGHLDLAKVLIELGADPTTRDTEFDSTPLGWAQHGHQHEVAAYLNGLGNETAR